MLFVNVKKIENDLVHWCLKVLKLNTQQANQIAVNQIPLRLI
jgi:hypothetical protein